MKDLQPVVEIYRMSNKQLAAALGRKQLAHRAFAREDAQMFLIQRKGFTREEQLAGLQLFLDSK
jgi:hypothetical protein